MRILSRNESVIVIIIFPNSFYFRVRLVVVYLNLAVFLAIFLGCLTNCFPFLLPFAFALFVAAFSPEESDFQAASGRYLLFPLEGLPDEVRHFCLPQSFKLCCGFLR